MYQFWEKAENIYIEKCRIIPYQNYVGTMFTIYSNLIFAPKFEFPPLQTHTFLLYFYTSAVYFIKCVCIYIYTHKKKCANCMLSEGVISISSHFSRTTLIHSEPKIFTLQQHKMKNNSRTGTEFGSFRTQSHLFQNLTNL